MRALLFTILAVLLSGCSTLFGNTPDGTAGCENSESVCIEITDSYRGYREKLERLLIRHEGYRRHPYDDNGSLSVGYARNLTTNGISEQEALYLLRNDLDRIEKQLQEKYPVVEELNPERYSVVVSMAYVLGMRGLSEFKDMWAAIERRDYPRAGVEIYMSKFCNDVGRRCPELAEMMWHGKAE